MTEMTAGESSTSTPTHRLRQIAELTGHEERVWCVAWNPVRPFVASCSADKTVRISHYQKTQTLPSSSSTEPDELTTTTNDEGNLTFRLQTSVSTEHTKTVRCVAWAPSGQTFATASFDANIGIWEQEAAGEDAMEIGDDDGGGGVGKGDWECSNLLEGHETECKCVAYSASGTLLASSSRDKTVWIWEVQPDSDFECMSVLMSHTQDVKCVAWHPTEEILASGSYDDTIKLYVEDPDEDWYDFQTLTAHTSTVWSLAFSPCGELLASASDDLTIRFWRREEQWKWIEVGSVRGHDRSIYSISWKRAPGVKAGDGVGVDRGWLASVSGDGKINVWDIRLEDKNLSVSLIASIDSAHGVCDVNCVTWCPRPGFEDYLATAGDDCAVRIWKIEV